MKAPNTFRALLVGVPAYLDGSIDDLPFIEGDLAELGAALEATSYRVTIHDPAQANKDRIETAIEFFICDSQARDTLFIFLSGHGIHYEGMDYLVPSGAMTRSFDFPSRCIPIEFNKYIDRSLAGDVVIFVDACREGISLLEKSAVNAASWSSRMAERAATRHLAYVYACSPGERARYADDGHHKFSLFSRALSQVVRTYDGPGDLAGIGLAVQDELDRLTGDHKLPLQQVRILTESQADTFIVLPRPEGALPGTGGVHPWVAAAADHVVWEQVSAGPAAERLRKAAVSLAGDLARSWERDRVGLAEDPWPDDELASRMNARTRWLLSTVLNPGKLLLSPAEAALLVVFPFLHEAFWARQAVKRVHVLRDEDRPLGQHKEYVRFEQFLAGYGRLVRRAARAAEDGKDDAAGGILWWLFHKWLPRQADCYDAEEISGLLHEGDDESRIWNDPLAAQVFGHASLVEMLRDVSADIEYLAGSDWAGSLEPVRLVASATDAEQRIREQLIGYLVAAACRFAIDPRALSEVIVDHLGISYQVGLYEMHDTVRSAAWGARGRTRVLTASCKHPAVELALREHVSGLGNLLGQIENGASIGGHLAPLEDMPTQATADRVLPHVAPDGRRSYDSSDLRFRLAEDRIQELLMGEQLYGDPALAIRELYQNALDACRYRQARSEFLRRSGTRLPDWRGRISFRQGYDSDGRPYLDCQDNGIGMGLRELGAVFSRGGIRFADLPEYIEERASWRSVGIEMFPNSRFGIGVLSYFMLADDITVTTCRMNRSGQPGDILEIHIAGPGALFRVRNLGPGSSAGTTIRLHLRNSDLSSADFLRKILVISDYDVEATDPDLGKSWPTGHLNFEIRVDYPGDRYQIDATETPDVWWCSHSGAMLADGLMTESRPFGVIVNLSGSHMPTLTVDRTQMLWYDKRHVSRLLYSQVPALFADGAGVLTSKWLYTLASPQPSLADEIFRRALELDRRPWTVAGIDVPVSVVGCCGEDEYLFRRINDPSGVQPHGDYPWYTDYQATAAGIGDRAYRTLTATGHGGSIAEITRWRFLAWTKANCFPGVTLSPAAGDIPLARPSDTILAESLRRNGWQLQPTSSGRSVPLGLIAYVATQVERSPQEIADRLAALGFTVPDVSGLADPVADDLPLLSVRGRISGPWLDSAVPVPVGHVVTLAAEMRISVAQAASRLARLGFAVPDAVILTKGIDDRDLAMLRAVDIQGSGRRDGDWISTDEPVPLGHLASTAEATGLTIRAVAERLAEFGYAVPDPADLPRHVDPADLLLVSRHGDGHEPWLAAGDVVHLGHLGYLAKQSKRSLRDVAFRLAELRFRTSDRHSLPEQLSEEDLILLSYGRIRRLGSPDPWLDPGTAVPAGHLTSAAVMTGRRVADIAARLTALGFVTASPETLPSRLSDRDLVILSGAVAYRGPAQSLLDFAQPVPLGHLAAVAVGTGQKIPRIAARLAVLGFTTPDHDRLPSQADAEEVVILSENCDGSPPWLDPAEPVPYSYLVNVARSGRSIPRVAARLMALGFRLPAELIVSDA